MRTLGWREIDDILLGASVFGCGGGGELEEGREAVRRVCDEGGIVTLAAVDELGAEAIVACPYAVGGLIAGEAGAYGDRPLATDHLGVLAVRALADHVGRDVDALIAGELGSTSVADAIVPAAILGVPVVDADCVGRAVPEVSNSMFCVHGLPAAPLAVVNEIGDTVLITEAADDLRVEALVRSLAVASRNLVYVADHPVTARRLAEAAVCGTITKAERMGRALRAAVVEGADAAAAVAAEGEGAVLFRGVVLSNEWVDRGGFTVGDVVIAGSGGDEGARLRVWFKNENLVAWRDTTPVVTAPDLIVVLGPDGLPVANPFVAPGMKVAVVGLPAVPAWTTARGLEFFSPRALGLDLNYVPFLAGEGGRG